MTITIKDKARTMLTGKLEAGQFLRVGVAEGGCAGLTYSAEIGRELGEAEKVVLEEGGIRIVAGQDSIRYLDGLVIDYSDDLLNGGLKFTNSNTKTTCGCGASFNLSGFPVISGGKCGG